MQFLIKQLTNTLSSLSDALPTMSAATDLNRPVVHQTKKLKSTKKRNKFSDGDEAAVTSVLINAINRLSDAPDSRGQTEAQDVHEAFLVFHGHQIRELMVNKSKTIQCRIRNRLNAFVDELLEEFIYS